MKLSQLIELLNKAHAQAGPDVEVLLCYEEGAMSEGYEEKNTEDISDIRLVNDWPLPGKSLITYEGEIQQKVVIFYDNHYKLKPSDGATEENAAQSKKPKLAVGQTWRRADGLLTALTHEMLDEHDNRVFKTNGGCTYRDNGKLNLSGINTFFPHAQVEHAELVELVSEASSV